MTLCISVISYNAYSITSDFIYLNFSINLGKVLSILFIFFRKPSLSFINLFVVLVISVIYSVLIFIPFLLLTLTLFCFFSPLIFVFCFSS